MTIKKRHVELAVVVIFIVILFFIAYRSDYNSFPKISKKIVDSTLIVKVIDSNNNEQFLGTGFIVDNRGYILTAKHNFEEISNDHNIPLEDFISAFGYVEIRTREGEKKDFRVTLKVNDDLQRKDVILLRIVDKLDIELTAIEIAKKKDVKKIGIEVGFTGYTESRGGFDLFISRGILSNKKLDVPDQTEPFYTVNAFSNFGYSGGPVFLNKNGKVIGIIEQTSSEIDPKTNETIGKTGIVLVPPIHEVPDIIAKLEK